MKIIKSKNFRAKQAWGALDIASMNGISTRLHWTDKPYKWHTNDGQEVFVVLDGQVEMKYKQDNKVLTVVLEIGDIFYASIGTEHIASPIGEARVLVVEKTGSI